MNVGEKLKKDYDREIARVVGARKALEKGSVSPWEASEVLGSIPHVGAAVFYLPIIAVAASELALLYNVEAGVVMYAVTLIGLVFGISLVHRMEGSHPARAKDYDLLAAVLKAVMLLPLLRIFNFAMPLALFRQIYWSLIVSGPILVTAWLLARNLKLTLKDVGFVKAKVLPQVFIVACGALFGLVEYFILMPQPIVSSLSFESAALPALILMFFTGFTEEILFRGFLQSLASKAFGALQGVAFAAVLFTVMHASFNSVPEMLYVFLVALFYGISFQKTGSIYGVMVSHGLANVLLFIVAPFYFG